MGLWWEPPGLKLESCSFWAYDGSAAPRHDREGISDTSQLRQEGEHHAAPYAVFYLAHL